VTFSDDPTMELRGHLGRELPRTRCEPGDLWRKRQKTRLKADDAHVVAHRIIMNMYNKVSVRP